jgi:hypothetical protein
MPTGYENLGQKLPTSIRPSDTFRIEETSLNLRVWEIHIARN